MLRDIFIFASRVNVSLLKMLRFFKIRFTLDLIVLSRV